MQDQKLMEYLKFDEYDLQADRMGQLTEKQKARLGQENQREKTQSWFAGGFLLLVALGGLVFATYAFVMNFDWALRIAFGCILPLVAGGLAYGFLSAALDKSRVKLQKVEGTVRIVKENYSGARGHTYHEHELPSAARNSMWMDIWLT